MSKAVHSNRLVDRDVNSGFGNRLGNQPLQRTTYSIKWSTMPNKYTWAFCFWAAMLEVINDRPAYIFKQRKL